MMSPNIVKIVAWTLFAYGSLAFGAEAAQPPKISARSYILVDGDTHRVVLAKNADERLQPASLTKMMTAYIVLDALRRGTLKWEQSVRVESADVSSVAGDEAKMHLRNGQVVVIQDLLAGLIIASANDAAMVLSRATAGSYEAFLAMMNDYAHRLGLNSTHFATPSGITTAMHYSTARDIAQLSLRLTEDFPVYLSFSSQREFTYGNYAKHNKNRLLEQDPRVDGLKTGHTAEAGYCLAATAKQSTADGRKGRRLFAVVLGAPSNDGRFIAGKALLDYGLH